MKKIKGLNFHQVAQEVAKEEGLKKSLSIAQIKEVLSIGLAWLYDYTHDPTYSVIKAADANRLLRKVWQSRKKRKVKK